MLFDSTLRRALGGSFAATLAVIVTIVITMMLIRTLGQAALGEIAAQDVVMLLGYNALGHLPTMLALSLFIAVVATLGRMYRDSEMAVWFASGVPLVRFVRPVFAVCWPVLLALVALALLVWPWVNGRSAELIERYAQRSDIARVAPGQFQTSSDGNRVFFIERDPQNDEIGRNVFVLSSKGDDESVVTARTGRLTNDPQGRMLRLEGGQRNDENRVTGERTLARFDSYSVRIGDADLGSRNKASPKSTPTLVLLRSSDPAGRGELVWRIGLVLGAANLLLLGIGLAATNPRRASNWNLLFALFGFSIYYNVINLSQAWVANGQLGIGAALACAHGAALLLAAGLLWWRDHGAHASWRRPAVDGVGTNPGCTASGAAAA